MSATTSATAGRVLAARGKPTIEVDVHARRRNDWPLTRPRAGEAT